ncbi:DUF1501 domain-containing protein [Planctomicrobium piriforme]|uniref:Tat (Twin-arginine translocation) pathway signal sequence n=1 Tax=Planctomicrobium piriforme TaxID=1576369 RepID=A0A1I3F916_9PLAN|nr:DUF1501 domain-containing protein [Planctomicrobium piriforme]SFI07705.1 Protein of unknown function [Planctomicrobium piriforme]
MLNNNLLHVRLNREGQITRRQLLRLAGGGFAALAGGGLLKTLGLNAAEMKKAGRSCIMVFLNGAPSQFETWDPKPGTATGGPTKAIATAIPGVEFAEYWPKMAQLMNDVSVIRSLEGKEAAHERGFYHLHTGHRLIGNTRYPHIGSLTAYKLGDPDSDIPNFVSLGNTESSGFLGVKVAPFISRPGELPDNVVAPFTGPRADRRMELLKQQDAEFSKLGASYIANEHTELYRKAAELMTSSRLQAFTVNGESDAVKLQYGNNAFGKGCLVARRLVEAGVPFVEVQRGGWDLHENLWQRMPAASAEVDQGLTTLISDLKQRGLLEKTLVVCLGEFGRTPQINTRAPAVGRDHWARNFNLLMAGGGVKGGVCVGKTSADGMEIAERPVTVDDLFQTICTSLKIDPNEELYTPEGRPVKVVDSGAPVAELLL